MSFQKSAQPLSTCVLVPVISPEDWKNYHSIRRDALFARLLPDFDYDENDPDEVKSGHLPHVLKCVGEVIGTVRIDIIDSTSAGLRLVAIRQSEQGLGYGSALLRLAENAVMSLGGIATVVNAHPSALTFYLKNGYRPGDWHDAGPPLPGLVRVGRGLA